MSKIIIFLVIAIVVVVGGFFFLNRTNYTTESVPEVTQHASPSPEAVSEEVADHAHKEGTEEIHSHNHAVTYSDSGFSPKEITIEAGDTVQFKNDSSRNRLAN